jgi:hypothetical protein
MCPGDGSDMILSQKLETHCQVCGGTIADEGDYDHREGVLEAHIFWGPNSFDGTIMEKGVGILGYAIYAVNQCGEKQGDALATIKALDVQPGGCCQKDMYEATLLQELATGVTSMTFMVVPLTQIGALDVGWITPTVFDWVNATNNKKKKGPTAADQASKLMNSAPATTPSPAPASTTTTTTAAPVVAVSMSLNIDYDQLSAETKDELKGKIQAVLATTANVDPSAVTVMLSAGSVKVDAKIKTANTKAAVESMESMDNDKVAADVVEAANSIPEVKEATEGEELTAMDVEVKMEEDETKTLNMNSAEGDASAVAATTPKPQAETSAANSPGSRLELLLLLLPLVAVWV